MSKLPNPTPNIQINLVPQDPFIDSILGKFLTWSLSIGRYIVILTELVVIMSFLSRFKLDRELTDLNESIAQQKSIILSYQSTEENFRTTQAGVDFIKKEQRNNSVLELLGFMEKNLPIDVKLNSLLITPTNWSVNVSALSAQSLKSTVDQIVKTNAQSEVLLSKVKLNSRTGNIDFDVNVKLKQTVTNEKPVKESTLEE